MVHTWYMTTTRPANVPPIITPDRLDIGQQVLVSGRKGKWTIADFYTPQQLRDRLGCTWDQWQALKPGDLYYPMTGAPDDQLWAELEQHEYWAESLRRYVPLLTVDVVPLDSIRIVGRNDWER